MSYQHIQSWKNRRAGMSKHNRSHSHYLPALLLALALLMLPPALSAKAGEGEKAQVDFGSAISRVAQDNIPAVVHIEVTQRQEMAGPRLPFENDPFFHYFFDMPGQQRKFNRELRGLGTGMIMDARGHILTNNHVVDHAEKIDVLLSNGKQYKAALVGADPKTDLAVIRIEAKETLPHVTFGNSDRMNVGNWVVAIGHPRGLDQTVTQGIISAKHRRGIMDPNGYQDFLQTDAAINPGNSGGPLLNLQGEVIGVNAAIASQSGGFEGIGFAIPSNMAVHVAQELIAQGKVIRGWLGVTIQALTPELAKSFGLDSAKGALIADVVKEGPAEKAGIRRGDVVITYREKEISDAGSFRNEVAATPVGSTVNVTVRRKGESKVFPVKIGNLESATTFLTSSVKDRLGADVRTVTSKEVKKYNLSPARGVAITWLDRDGSLTKAGFELGDIILEINGVPVEDVSTFADLVGSLKAQEMITLLALDHRSGQTGYVQVLVP
jgi:serine protease Do